MVPNVLLYSRNAFYNNFRFILIIRGKMRVDYYMSVRAPVQRANTVNHNIYLHNDLNRVNSRSSQCLLHYININNNNNNNYVLYGAIPYAVAAVAWHAYSGRRRWGEDARRKSDGRPCQRKADASERSERVSSSKYCYTNIAEVGSRSSSGKREDEYVHKDGMAREVIFSYPCNFKFENNSFPCDKLNSFIYYKHKTLAAR